MKTTTIRVHSGDLEVYIDEKNEYFEIWTVGSIRGIRQVLDHHLTHDSLEERLCYNRPGDILWREAEKTSIPGRLHANAKEMEGTIKNGKFIDCSSVVDHLGFGSIDLIGADKKVLATAKAAMIGNWTDSEMMIDLYRDHTLLIGGNAPQLHILNVGWHFSDPVRNWWNFEGWRFCTSNKETGMGQVIAVVQVDERELHFYSAKPDQIAHIFTRSA